MQERSAGAVARFIRLPVIHIRIRQGDMANLTGLVNQDQIDRMFIKQSRETAVYQRYFDRISLSGKQNRRSRHLLQLDTVTEMVPDIIENKETHAQSAHKQAYLLTFRHPTDAF